MPQVSITINGDVYKRQEDPTINDHLGDAYWQGGRKIEARYQWRRALQFKPEADLSLIHI